MKRERQSQLRTSLQGLHTKRLDNLLHSNELMRVHMDADGNSFFNSIQKSLNKDADEGTSLRNDICNHILENSEQYLPFFTGDAEDPHIFDTFHAEVVSLKQDGQWNMSVADCLPFAVANFFQMHVRIFSSNITQNVLNFDPTFVQRQSEGVIHLAYVSHAGNEHYDAVAP